MPNTSQVIFNEIDASFQVPSILQGVAALKGRTVRGEFGTSKELWTSWEAFNKHYGGENITSDAATLVKRAIERGAAVRFTKMGHYTDPVDPGTLDAVKATIDEAGSQFANDGIDDLFNLTIKYAGADYNNITIQILAASNGDADAFDLSITHANDSRLNEYYSNLKIIGTPTVEESDFLSIIQEESQLFNVVYLDLSALSAPLRPNNGTWGMENGTDGTAPDNNDYIGDSAGKTGNYGFDAYDDFEVLADLDNEAAAVQIAGASYAANRTDIIYFAHLANSNDTVAELQAARDLITTDTRFLGIFAGGLEIPDPINAGLTKEISELGDIIGAAMRSSIENGPWYSFAGETRGQIFNVLGVVNNFATNITDLNALANRQINLVVQKNSKISIKGNFSGQLATSRKSFINVVRLLIYIRKSIRPSLEKYLEEPNDFRMFKDVYNEVNPFFESLASSEKRALVDYEWRGDQFASNDAQLKVNNRPDLDKGKYKVELYLKEIVSLQEFTVDIISTPSGVEFEDNLN